jgi:hypothetical protein
MGISSLRIEIESLLQRGLGFVISTRGVQQISEGMVNVLERRADFGKGSPANPMSYDEVAEKFYGCADYAKWPTPKSKQIVEYVRGLEQATDLRELVRLCTP